MGAKSNIEMREIKFRAWDSDRQKMIYTFSDNLNGWKYMLRYEERLFCGNYKDNGDWNEPTLMQFTGLCDKTGKDIYEGDIVRYIMPGPPPEPIEIEYTEEVHFSYGSFDVDGAPVYVVNEICEVIGNIYQDAELLKPVEHEKSE